jgi:adenylate kinase family enzyme
MNAMQRVIILGCGGAGKSTLARALAERTGLPVFHLDRAFWKAGWVESSREEFDAAHDVILANDRWIIDGNYTRTIDRRAADADTIVVLDLPTISCMYGILKRALLGYGRTRPDMADGCPEKLDWEFTKWVWRFRRDTRPQQMAAIEAARGTKTLYLLKSRRDVRRWLDQVPSKAR